MEILKKAKSYFKDLFFSLFDTKYLFKFYKRNWITPIIILLSTIALIVTPYIIVYSTLSAEQILEPTPYLENALTDMLSKGYSCSIADNKLSCDEQYPYYDYTYTNDQGLSTVYRVYVNSNLDGVNLKVEGYFTKLPTDNYIIFAESGFETRYTARDSSNESVKEYKKSFSYSDLNGLNFKDIQSSYLNIEDPAEGQNYLIQQSHEMLVKGYKTIAKNEIYIVVIMSVLPYLLFIFIASLIIKGNYLFKKKGFSILQSLKITLVSTLQSLIITLALTILTPSISYFTSILGLTICARIIYIYVKYTGSKKNMQWIEEIYKESHDERFNV